MVGGNGRTGVGCFRVRRQLARGYHGRAVGAGDKAETAAPDQLQRPRVAGLNDTVQLALAGSLGDLLQGVEQPATDAVVTEVGQHHQGEFRRALLRDVLAVAQYFAVGGDGQHGDSILPIDRIEPL